MQNALLAMAIPRQRFVLYLSANGSECQVVVCESPCAEYNLPVTTLWSRARIFLKLFSCQVGVFWYHVTFGCDIDNTWPYIPGHPIKPAAMKHFVLDRMFDLESAASSSPNGLRNLPPTCGYVRLSLLSSGGDGRPASFQPNTCNVRWALARRDIFSAVLLRAIEQSSEIMQIVTSADCVVVKVTALWHNTVSVAWCV